MIKHICIWVYVCSYNILHELPVYSGTKAMAMHLKFQGGRRPILFTFLSRYGQMGWPIAIVFELYSQASVPFNRIHNIPSGRRGRKLLDKRECSTWGRAGYTRSNNIYALEYGGKLYTDSVFFSPFLAPKRNKIFRIPNTETIQFACGIEFEWMLNAKANVNARRRRWDGI